MRSLVVTLRLDFPPDAIAEILSKMTPAAFEDFARVSLSEITDEIPGSKATVDVVWGGEPAPASVPSVPSLPSFPR